MRQQPPGSDSSPIGSRYDAWIVVGMAAVLVLPASLTLLTVEQPRPGVDPALNPTPLGYTWSLLLFVVPMVVIGWWFFRHPGYTLQKRAFWLTVGILSPLGILLDLLFGRKFFTFLNREATLQVDIPAVGGGVPIEELVFYLTGFILVLLLYIWADELWLGAYNIPDYATAASGVDRLVRFDPRSLVVGVVLLAGAVLCKRFIAAEPEGFPWYFTYLVVVAVVPSVGLFRSVEPFINWRAFSLTFFLMLLVSLLWEATLGVPYEWWNYNHEAMMGIFIDGWTNLPIEAVCVWFAVTYTSVLLYETIKIQQASGRPLKNSLFGDGI
jgi:hypothetical protein